MQAIIKQISYKRTKQQKSTNKDKIHRPKEKQLQLE